MTNPVTPNIGLNKIDRTSPATTYFDLEKYIDQNADKVDRFAGEASQAIQALQQRLDTEARREVVLQPGLQIVKAERSAPFSLSGIKGRTLVNLAGRMSNRSVNDPAVTTLSVGNGTTGRNTETINVSVKNTNEGYIVYRQIDGKEFTLIPDKYYLISMDVKVNSISGPGQLKAGATWYGAVDVDNTKTGVWQRVYHSFKATAERAFLNPIVGTCYAGDVFATANFDVRNVSLYEISKADNMELPLLSPEQRDIKYPYVDSVQPVRNPYVVRYGENLTPPFYEWQQAQRLTLTAPYKASITSMSENIIGQVWSGVEQACFPETTYSYSVKHNGVIQLAFYDSNMQKLSGEYVESENVTAKAPADAAFVGIYVANKAGAGTFSFENPTLSLGPTPKPFNPREESMLAMQTDLFANPLTGTNADEVFEKDGQYFKLAKWKSAVLGRDLTILSAGNIAPGFKQVSFSISNDVIDSAIAVKYDGKVIRFKYPVDGPDQLNNSNGHLRITVANADSGWGDNYEPAVDEIKAYFMGWKMYPYGDAAGAIAVYNGTGTKGWCFRVDGKPNNTNSDYTGGVSVLPTTQAPNWMPYQLVYQLVSPTVEPIVSEGVLTFNEGDNQIEVGTGIVLRESAKLNYYLANGNYYINNTGVSGSLLKEKVSFILRVYRNGQVDNPAKIENDVNAYGKQHVRFLPSDFDPSATYSVTYLMLGTFPTMPFTGSYPANEKTLLEKLTDVVQQNTSAVSVLMNKKLDKDTSGWITPTLLNGWEQYDSTSYLVGFKKIGNIVILTGTIKNGVSGHICVLPEGYRPQKIVSGLAISRNENQSSAASNAIEVRNDGRVYIGIGDQALNAALQFTVIFEAEQ
ncbi:hypothetical protein [Paenibacillus lactis]|uniref:hypothetical protein n=1 Tax=Paenibacillus lactis TaxID=228574 RepID=UPI00367B38E1